MKKLLSLFVVFFLALGLVACEADSPTDDPKPDTTKDTTPPEFMNLESEGKLPDIVIKSLSTGTWNVYTGITVRDAVDGEIDNSKLQVIITDLEEELEVSSIPLNKSGYYLVEYTAWDSARNFSTASRNVTVGTPGTITNPNKCKAYGYIYDRAEVQKDYQLVWSEEFDYEGLLDEKKWTYEIGNGQGGWGNNESQYYVARDTSITYVNGEYLTITAKKVGGQYKSARIITRDKAYFKYGKMEARIMMPSGTGGWPAFWMMPQASAYGGWPHSGEIDIMEYVTSNRNSIQHALHMGASYGNTKYVSRRNFENVETTWHTYGIEWYPDRIYFYVDDVQTYIYSVSDVGCADSTRWPFDQSFYFILNLAVGGNLGGYIDDSTFPMEFKIDYVRVYQSEIIKNLKPAY